MRGGGGPMGAMFPNNMRNNMGGGPRGWGHWSMGSGPRPAMGGNMFGGNQRNFGNNGNNFGLMNGGMGGNMGGGGGMGGMRMNNFGSPQTNNFGNQGGNYFRGPQGHTWSNSGSMGAGNYGMGGGSGKQQRGFRPTFMGGNRGRRF